ncbi:SAM-dependent methyltransferase [Streptomyces sp. DSM 44915]|uniref:SAM-dependent methyltransferase n=1 Tax=Streptomyces chisholmiae TaxID=3075540 RepID=A0ABU2JTV5_9ACTN|nr:SAM-dependent methyltransferase [Streptomyces sp. DSM 44915]MDT0268413.1 SAM-dependent methyltransferase [Streptomyces sp. DSM 44915]
MTDDPSTARDRTVSKIDTSVPHSARIWNYWLGGSDNYEVDRIAGDQYREAFPGIVDVARASRQFLVRSIRYLARDAGVRQFLDVGTGLPTVDNTHQVAQRINPEARIVYVDHDPLVLLHANALLTSTDEGHTAYLAAELHEPERILAAAADHLDLDQPVGLILSGILGHVDTYQEAHALVRRLLDGVAPGSHLSLNEGTDTDPAYCAAQAVYNDSGAIPYRLRTMDEIRGYFEGLELVDPGVVSVPRWRPDLASAGHGRREVGQAGGVGRKP